MCAGHGREMLVLSCFNHKLSQDASVSLLNNHNISENIFSSF